MFHKADDLNVRTRYPVEVKIFSNDTKKVYVYRTPDLEKNAEFFVKNMMGYEEVVLPGGSAQSVDEKDQDEASDVADQQPKEHQTSSGPP